MSEKPASAPDTKPKHAGGRPSIYTPELANLICKRVATHPQGLPILCRQYDDLPTAETIRVWRWEKSEFSAKYNEAKRFQAELMAESIEDIHEELLMDSYHDDNDVRRIDSGLVAAARLAVDSRKWMASKLAPKIYGDKQQNEITIKHEDKLTDLE